MNLLNQYIQTKIIPQTIFDLRSNSISFDEKLINYLVKLQLRLSTDNLTNAYKRNLLDLMIDFIIETHQSPIILFVDMDDFKSINEKHGHNIGDQGLQQTSSIIKSCMPDSSYLFRYGGDEFIVITEEKNINVIYDSLYKIRSELSTINHREDYELRITIGISRIYQQTRSDVYKNLSRLLRTGKTLSKNTIVTDEIDFRDDLSNLAGVTGLEPATSSVTGKRSNH